MSDLPTDGEAADIGGLGRAGLLLLGGLGEGVDALLTKLRIGQGGSRECAVAIQNDCCQAKGGFVYGHPEIPVPVKVLSLLAAQSFNRPRYTYTVILYLRGLGL